jgi:hypothetical protein
MSAAFPLDLRALAAEPGFGPLATILRALGDIDSTASFNHFCREAIRWHPPGGGRSGAGQFGPLLDRVQRGGAGVIPTSWGGVVVTLHEHPKVEKYLVIRAGGYLALEKHEQKDERIEVREGSGLLLARDLSSGALVAHALAPGHEFHFPPGMEHCLIGTENLLVFERSTDPKGMDQDLIFLYEPDAAA